MAAIPKESRILVNGIPFEKLPKEYQEKIIMRNTDVVEKIISAQVMKMIDDGKSEEEIKKFLEIDRYCR